MATFPLRPRRRPLPDPRILIGVVLVVASALGTTALVSALTRSVVVYRAAHALVAGERVTADRLVAASVRLGDAQGLYLTGPLPAAGLVATRTVAAGEVVPRSAVGTSAELATATVVVDLASPLADGVGAGTDVDLWSAPRLEGAQERYGPPVVLVNDAVVARVPTSSGLIAGGREDAVEVQVPRDEVAALLEAQADGSRIAAVAVGGTR
ncbi:SAF domain-containing protein [Amnibacterium endophyticum]|uniref:SAF domain-containing protein n=1 Tax=Amnibacterium endophyticum TaxID=2109337 RepID=A0ABW4LAQ5_9MICO